MKENLIETLKNMRMAEPHHLEELIHAFIPKSFEKGLLLSTPEYSFPVLYYIEKGLARGYFDSGDNQHTAWILEEGFILPSAGYFHDADSIEYISFLEHSTGYALNLNKADELGRENPVVYRILLEIYEQGLHQSKERELMLRITHAADRYLYFMQSHPKLVHLPIHNILASLLNIQAKYLYKIKQYYRRK
ncbi:Crp/Fnr family transcriptional regulator [Pedobacter agri]|uniref:Crp/Fnr family transcriptional regulator n=1 Tax=Pedobacter agri TaxID=454586 RepID=A0A9X3IAI5_9SPHI|nr:Crp/Fnr family transcriptional regulator [Pedobacter agri]MCX3265633.1 Crp/Fnr family transcriptional regulator [Pedobacter agri]